LISHARGGRSRFENEVLRRIFGPKKEDVRGGWRKLLIENLCNLYSSPNIIKMTTSRRKRLAEHVVFKRDMKNGYKILFRKLEGDKTLWKPRCRWEDNIKTS
jgi:hypothetical protein